MTANHGHRSDENAALIAVADSLSFVGAGRALQRHPTIVSKRIAAMERRLGIRLIERTTRQVRLTEAGALLATRLKAAEALVAEAEAEASADAAELRGLLRLAFPGAMGRLWLAPMLPEFLRAHPLLKVEVDYSESYVDLVARGYDAAVRVGALSDSRLSARKIATHRRILCASPSYLEARGTPSTPRDLLRHNCLGFSKLASYPEWRLADGVREETVLAAGSLTSNDSEALLAAAKADVGILGAGAWLMRRDLERGALIRVLPGWHLNPEGSIFLVRPSSRLAPAKTEAFSTWIAKRFASDGS